MKYVALLITILFALTCLVSCGGGDSEKSEEKDQARADQPAKAAPDETRTIKIDQPAVEVAMLQTDRGEIVIRLYPESAPQSVKLFEALVKKNYYDGLPFYRIVPGFIIEAGDTAAGQVESTDFFVPFEQNNLGHTIGTVSFQRRMEGTESTAGQFFILLKNAPDFNENYTAFGKVISGIRVVEEISNMPANQQHAPKEKVIIKDIVLGKMPISGSDQKEKNLTIRIERDKNSGN